MKAVISTGILGAVAIVLLSEVMNLVVTASAMQHVASYNAWMAL
ncbi:hypothetical protein [Methylocystis sp. S23]|jgi:hypothetical protein